MTETSPFAVPDIIDQEEVFDEPSNSFKEAFTSATLFLRSIEEQLHRRPRNVDPCARVISTEAGPYTIAAASDSFHISVNGVSIAALALTTGTGRTAQQIVDEINSNAALSVVVLASVVAIEDSGSHILLETKAEGTQTRIEFLSTDEAGAVLGFPQGTYISQYRSFNTLMNSATNISGIDNNVPRISQLLIQHLREINDMFVQYKHINQLNIIENAIGRKLPQLAGRNPQDY